MKKLFIIVIASLLAIQVEAQGVSGGLHVGTNVSWLSVDHKKADSDGAKLGFNFDAFVDFKLTDNFVFTTGLGVLSNGGSVKYDIGSEFSWDDADYSVSSPAKITYKLQHLEIPLSIKGQTQEIGYVTYFAKLGTSLSFAYRVRSDIEATSVLYKGTATPADDTSDLNIKENINPFNVGWHVGAGADYSLGGTTALTAEILFSQSLLPIAKENVTKSSINKRINVKPSMITLKVGVKF